jgi:hypothetical protein
VEQTITPGLFPQMIRRLEIDFDSIVS